MRIYRGRVTDVSDVKNLGRIKVELQAFCSPGLGVDPEYPQANTTAWCHVVTPLAGPGYGFYLLPQVGDTVVATPLENGEFLVLGYHWTGTQGKPAEGTASARVIKVPAGGSIIIKTDGGGEVKVLSNGNVEVNGNAGKVVTTKMVCAYTGKEHPQGLGSFKAGN